MRFNEENSKFNHALEVDADGVNVTSKQKTTAMIILSEPLNPEPYTEEDFPEDDIPGTYDTFIEEGQEPAEEPEEEQEEEEVEPSEVAVSQST